MLTADVAEVSGSMQQQGRANQLLKREFRQALLGAEVMSEPV
jgi:hypothetical protein